ncbi:hypothetical protein CR513_30527, partial [Mucuna pruriens]
MLSHILPILYSKDFIYDIIHYRIDKVLGKSKYAKFPITDTSKPGVTGVTTLINVESNSGIKLRKANQAESNSGGRGKPTPTPTISQLTPSIVKQDISPQSNTKLNPLLEHLKYAYLGDHQQFPMIIRTGGKLLEVLRKHKKVIGWTLADLTGINPSICMHKILIEEDA